MGIRGLQPRMGCRVGREVFQVCKSAVGGGRRWWAREGEQGKDSRHVPRCDLPQELDKPETRLQGEQGLVQAGLGGGPFLAPGSPSQGLKKRREQ